jgi:hypothetical protein
MCTIAKCINQKQALSAFAQYGNCFNLNGASGNVNGALYDLITNSILIGHAIISDNGELQIVCKDNLCSFKILNRFIDLLENKIIGNGKAPTAVIQPSNPNAIIIIKYLLRRGYLAVGCLGKNNKIGYFRLSQLT